MRAGRLIALGYALIAPMPASAQTCDGLFDTLALARIAPSAPKTFFIKDKTQNPACPAAGDTCRRPAFLLPGDLVETGNTNGAFTCALFTGPKSLTTGFLPTAALQPLVPGPFNAAEWTGTWQRTEASLSFAVKGNRLTVTGEATFGSLDPARVKRGAVNTGEINADLPLPATSLIRFADDGATPFDKADQYTCKVEMQRSDDALYVRDNMQCGGMNVSFTGTYRRKR